MRTPDAEDAPRAGGAHRGPRRANLLRIVRIVVIHRRAATRAGALETAMDPPKSPQPFLQGFPRRIQPPRQGEGRAGVLGVVTPGHGELEPPALDRERLGAIRAAFPLREGERGHPARREAMVRERRGGLRTQNDRLTRAAGEFLEKIQRFTETEVIL